ncbi:hypothetical protein DEO72_LG1g2998 [Vigna unguiculata]|uniref:Uncharacterized protein n=1 Tax=Vigna unguiculata TaxID=3917 RepID=A0A4D6KVQ5_VIGUN|nr:hypothetical protein DEO72_LG1g2998 [Vigna unguiculata]
MIILVLFSGVSSCALTCVRKLDSVYVTGVASSGTGSPFLFVYGDDRLIRYTRADVDTGDAEDPKATE